MSRIGKVPVIIPPGVDVTIDDQNVRVKGPKGDLTQEFSPLAQITKTDDTIVVKPSNSSRAAQLSFLIMAAMWASKFPSDCSHTPKYFFGLPLSLMSPPWTFLVGFFIFFVISKHNSSHFS